MTQVLFSTRWTPDWQVRIMTLKKSWSSKINWWIIVAVCSVVNFRICVFKMDRVSCLAELRTTTSIILRSFSSSPFSSISCSNSFLWQSFLRIITFTIMFLSVVTFCSWILFYRTIKWLELMMIENDLFSGVLAWTWKSWNFQRLHARVQKCWRLERSFPIFWR